MKSVRLLRIEEGLVREVAGILRNRMKDPRMGMVTVTGAEVSPDIQNARIYVSVLGSETEKQSALAALSHAVSFIRGEVGRVLKLKFTPDIRFFYDDSAERGERMDGLLKGLHDSA